MGLDEVWLRVPKAHDYHRLCVISARLLPTYPLPILPRGTRFAYSVPHLFSRRIGPRLLGASLPHRIGQTDYAADRRNRSHRRPIVPAWQHLASIAATRHEFMYAVSGF